MVGGPRGDSPERARAKAQPPKIGVVLRTERITPHMVRIVLGGEGLAGFESDVHADAYVKLLFPEHEVEGRSPVRSYTVRAWDAEATELTLDLVVHGDEGLAGPWAASARPGDTIALRGPGGGYTPSPSAPWHLLVGDESALPAIVVAAARVPEGVPVVAVVEVAAAVEEQAVVTPGTLDLTWVHRDTSAAAPGLALVDAVRAIDLAALVARHGGTPHVFLHGEAGAVREVRRDLRAAGLLVPGSPDAGPSVSGYWRDGRTDEMWRAEKRAWNEAVEQDDAELSVQA